MERYKHVRLRRQTWNELVSMKMGMETFDDVIRKLLTHFQKSKKAKEEDTK